MKVVDIQKMHHELNGIREKKLPVKMAFILSRNLKKLDDVVSDLEENRDKLVQKYGERDEEGNLVVGEEGGIRIINPDDFMNEITEILNADVELTLDTITIDDIEKCDRDGYDNLTVEEVGALSCMIAEETYELQNRSTV